ncbi:ABC transporter permease [Hamadaea tsunoensis]|uniref:ABC transporter permease n=1 Tax=Hamadaea tsunoensis TaxID=53368 RepID=UPI00048315B2|nr:FtsX-like permease family protein [Hamadaea tsunoensis]
MLKAMLRGLLAHKLRLLLSALAIVLGTMFMSAAFVAGDTVAQGFTSLFSTVNSNLDVQVTGVSATGQDNPDVITALVPQSVADQVAKVDGVQESTAQVISDGARVIDKNGKVVPGTAPRFGAGWTGTSSLLQMREGNPPSGPDQIAISANLAQDTGYTVGDKVDVITLQPRKTFQLVGIFGYAGGRDSLAGETTVAFTMPVAQELMLGKPGNYTSVDVKAAAGVSQEELKQRVQTAVGPQYKVQTADEAAKSQASGVDAFVNVLKTGLTVFAVIGLITGAFLIFNTFSMLVAQRTRELALYRSFGASRGQVTRSVLTESVLLGLASAIVGLIIGIGVGWLLKKGLEALSHTNLPVSGVVVKPYVVVLTLLVGILFTVVAALVPSLRASRVPPIAAMREASTPDKPLRTLTVLGLVTLLVGVAFLVLKLTKVWKDPLWLVLGGGCLLVFAGVVMLAPALSRPVTRGLGALFGGSVPARLGTRNTGRNPRRTAVTAAALMIGVTLATAAGVFASSVKAGVTDLFKNDMKAQLIVQTSDFTGTTGFDPALQAKMRAIPGVTNAVAVRTDQVKLGGKSTGIGSADALAAAEIFTLTAKDGTIRPLQAGEIILDENAAKSLNASVGTELPLITTRGGEKAEKVVAIIENSQTWSGPMLNTTDAAGFTSPYAQQGYVQVGPDGDVGAVKDQLNQLFADNPEVNVVDQEQLIKQSTSFLDVILAILYVLLGLTIVVAVLGVINTLLLSVYERTREIGMIRAIGMNRASTAWMITVESILISFFGALLGVVVGTALGVAIVKIFGGDFLKLTIPWAYLIITLVLAVIAGVVAAILPAIRAGRLNVLQAIAYE